MSQRNTGDKKVSGSGSNNGLYFINDNVCNWNLMQEIIKWHKMWSKYTQLLSTLISLFSSLDQVLAICELGEKNKINEALCAQQ